MEFWKNGLLPSDPAKITTNYVLGEDGTEHHDFERVMRRKSANIIITVTFNIHLWSKILVHLQVQQFQILFALYAVNMMPLRTFMLLGNFMCLNRN